MIDWNAAKAFTMATTSAVFDTTPCRMKPMVAPSSGRDVNARIAPDASRIEFDFLALVDLEPSQDSIPRHLPADPGMDGKMVAYDAVISAMTDQWPYQAKRLDRIAVGEVLYQIMVPRRDGSPRIAFYVNRVK